MLNSAQETLETIKHKFHIHTIHEPKPASDRRHDWSATFDNYEPGCPIGHGATEGIAILDLLHHR